MEFLQFLGFVLGVTIFGVVVLGAALALLAVFQNHRQSGIPEVPPA